MRQRLLAGLGAVILCAAPGAGASEAKTSDIDRTAAPIATDIPSRPLTFELGDAFLGTGNISEGFELPTGAVWQPSLLLFGQYRSALQAFHRDHETRSEWANRLDLFAQLRLTGTERVLLGLRPLDRDGVFSGYQFEPDASRGKVEEYNLDLNTLYFEGEVGEIFPRLDAADSRPLDIGFAIGRQPIFKQEGIMINDVIDALGITRNSLVLPGASNLRITTIVAWNDIHRNDNAEDGSANLAGIFAEADFPCCTVDLDLAFVDADSGDGAYLGLSSVQRLGHFNTALRLNSSWALDGESDRVSDGTLLLGELSWTPESSHDLVYLNGFIALDRYASAARGPASGGPLGRVGILFETPGMGRYGAPIRNRADDSVGFALGMQRFFNNTRGQYIIEIGARQSTRDSETRTAGVAGRLQHAMGQRYVLRLDAFASDPSRAATDYGLRCELLVKF